MSFPLQTTSAPMNWNTASTAILRLELIRHFSQYRSARGAAALRLYSHFPSFIFNFQLSIFNCITPLQSFIEKRVMLFTVFTIFLLIQILC